MECLEVLGFLCIEPRIAIGTLINSSFGIVGLIGVFIAYKQFRRGKIYQQLQTARDLQQEFLSNENRIRFIYKLDYEHQENGWRFNPDSFRHSEEERYLDSLLYFFSFVGLLTKQRELSSSNLIWLRSWAKIILDNNEVLRYLEWLKSPDQIPNHDSFSGIVYLYEVFFGKNTDAYRRLSSYLK